MAEEEKWWEREDRRGDARVRADGDRASFEKSRGTRDGRGELASLSLSLSTEAGFVRTRRDGSIPLFIYTRLGGVWRGRTG